MHLPSYDIIETTSVHSEFKFVSSGPHGEVTKFLIFELLYPQSKIYNLALVDVLENGTLSDASVSNNGDLRKIVTTVVKVLIYYTDLYPERIIFFQGSDNEGRRNSIYQRAISQYLLILSQYFFIEGFINDSFKEPFNPLNSYQAFLVKRK